MNKQEFVVILAKENGISVMEANEMVDRVFEELRIQMSAGNTIKIRNFGTFAVREHGDKPFKNPITKEQRILEAHRKPIFIASKTLKQQVKDGSR